MIKTKYMDEQENQDKRVTWVNPLEKRKMELQTALLVTDKDYEEFAKFNYRIYNILGGLGAQRVLLDSLLGDDVQLWIWQVPLDSLNQKLRGRFEYAALELLERFVKGEISLTAFSSENDEEVKEIQEVVRHFSTEDSPKPKMVYVESELLRLAAEQLPDGELKNQLENLL